MIVGLPVVHRTGKDSEIYRISSIQDGDTCEIISYINGRAKTVSLSQLREAADEELMVGTRLKA